MEKGKLPTSLLPNFFSFPFLSFFSFFYLFSSSLSSRLFCCSRNSCNPCSTTSSFEVISCSYSYCCGCCCCSCCCCSCSCCFSFTAGSWRGRIGRVATSWICSCLFFSTSDSKKKNRKEKEKKEVRKKKKNTTFITS